MKTITTVDELEALPEGAVVREDGSQDRIWIFEKDADGAWGTPWSSSSWDVRLPATLIHPVIFDAEDVERAAKEAFEIRDDPYDDDEWDDLGSSDKELYYCQARAVLGAVGSVGA